MPSSPPPLPFPLTKKPTGRSLVTKVPDRINVAGGIQAPVITPQGHFERSLTTPLSADDLQRVSQTILFDRAIERISNGVAGMAWTISVPPDLHEDPEAHKKARDLTKALSQPNRGLHDTYTKMVKALIRDLLVYGAAIVERQPGTKDFQPFWLWPVSVRDIKLDPDWDGSIEGIHPRFWYCPKELPIDQWKGIMNENMFMIQSRTSTTDVVPPSPVQLAYEDMSTWLGLHGFQARTVSQAVRDYMICLEDETEEGLASFREYWRTTVVGRGEIPIIGGSVNVVKFGARNDAELFLGFTEYLTGLLALEFGLSRRDFGLTDTDNRATADVAQSESFQDAILPIAVTVVEHLNIKGVDFYEPGYELSLADIEPRKESEEAQTATTVYEKGLITKNEGRRRIGEDPIPGGDKFMDGSKAGDEPTGQQQPNPNSTTPSPPSSNSGNGKSAKTLSAVPSQDNSSNGAVKQQGEKDNAIKPSDVDIPVAAGKIKSSNKKTVTLQASAKVKATSSKKNNIDPLYGIQLSLF